MADVRQQSRLARTAAIGGVALEIFGPLVVSSVISTLIAHTFEGNEPIYPMPDYTLRSGREVLAYLVLGVLCAFASIAFTKGLGLVSKLFRMLDRIPLPLHPAIGGALLGLLALQVPYVLGSGGEVIDLALQGHLGLTMLLVLPLLKLVATALTSGSGGSGGLFTPALFVGAMVGGAYGNVVHELFPQVTAPSGAYAAVGMAAIAAGTSHAPISAILMLAELTDNRGLILPLMVAAITSSLLARKLYPHSMYTEPLARKGIDLSWRMEEAALAGIEVRQLVRADPDTLRPTDSYRTVVERFMTTTRRQRLFVLGDEGQLLGAVSFHDIKHLLDDPGTLTAVVAHDLMTPVEPVLESHERLHRAVHVFAGSDYERLPVVDAESGRFAGVLSKRDVLGVYAQEVLGRPAMLAKLATADSDGERDTIQLPPDFAVRLVPVPAALVGRTLAEARLPQATGCRVIEIKRPVGDGQREPLVPDAATRLEAGDELLLMGPTAALEKLEAGAVDFAALLTAPAPVHGAEADPTLAGVGQGPSRL